MSLLHRLLIIALGAFVVHFAWEYLHIPLYVDHGDIARLPHAFYATLGDVMYVLLGVILVTLFKRSFAWMNTPSRNNYIALAIVGFLIALFVEYKGLMLGKWIYTDAMPMIPLLNVGLSPLIQMTILLPFSVWLSSWILTKRCGACGRV